MQIKLPSIRRTNSNSQPHIAAHLQGAQKPTHKANLAKELQLPTHGNQLSIQKVITTLYCIIKHFAGLREKKTKRKNKGLRPLFFPLINSFGLKKRHLITTLRYCLVQESTIPYGDYMKTENNLVISTTNPTHIFTASAISIYFKVLKSFLQERRTLKPN